MESWSRAQVLEACLRAGARAARPGEFTERAFLNGKMDLTQAEAVMDLIRAQTDLALRSATEQLEGRLGEAIRAIRDELIELLAHVEAAIDFPEEGIAPDEGDETCAHGSIRSANKSRDLLATADQGRILREGVRVVIYGADQRRQIEPAQSSARLRPRDRQRNSGHHPRHDRRSRSICAAFRFVCSIPPACANPQDDRRARGDRAHRKIARSRPICSCTSSIATRRDRRTLPNA